MEGMHLFQSVESASLWIPVTLQIILKSFFFFLLKEEEWPSPLYLWDQYFG